MSTALARSALALSAVLLLGAAETGTGIEPEPQPLAEDVAPAARAPEPTLEGGTAARLIHPVTPAYPEAARRRMQEGWVILSFVVGVDGTANDPIIEDSSGVDAFEKSALAAIKQTRFAPATWNGQPIQQCAAELRYVYALKGLDLGARNSFIRGYREINTLTEQHRMQEAEAKLKELSDQGTWSNYEAARLWVLNSTLQKQRGDKAGAVTSLQRATLVEGSFLEPKLYRAVLVELFRLEADLGMYSAALSTHDRMTKLRPPLLLDGVEKVVADIQRAIHSPQALSFEGKVEYRSGCEEGRPNWKHELLRRKFAFDAVNGKADDFQLRCDWKLVEGKITTDKTWQVPKSWGYCRVFVFGDVGTTVRLLEYPENEAPASGQAPAPPVTPGASL